MMDKRIFELKTNGSRRIVLTGGPGGGKTTAADLFRREISDAVVLVPESATMLFAGGLPRVDELHAQCAAQNAIFHTQRSLEVIQSTLFPERILLCDRGTVDGAAYWPSEAGDFFENMGTTLEAELARYDAVIFFESAAVGDMSIAGGNPTRIENNAQAIKIDRRLRDLWSKHPRFVFVAHNASFFKKITFGLAALESMVGQLNHDAARAREAVEQA
jgi:predicted ATPase